MAKKSQASETTTKTKTSSKAKSTQYFQISKYDGKKLIKINGYFSDIPKGV